MATKNEIKEQISVLEAKKGNDLMRNASLDEEIRKLKSKMEGRKWGSLPKKRNSGCESCGS